MTTTSNPKKTKLKNNCKKGSNGKVSFSGLDQQHQQFFHNLNRNGFGYITIVSKEQVSVSTQS